MSESYDCRIKVKTEDSRLIVVPPPVATHFEDRIKFRFRNEIRSSTKLINAIILLCVIPTLISWTMWYPNLSFHCVAAWLREGKRSGGCDEVVVSLIKFPASAIDVAYFFLLLKWFSSVLQRQLVANYNVTWRCSSCWHLFSSLLLSPNVCARRQSTF